MSTKGTLCCSRRSFHWECSERRAYKVQRLCNAFGNLPIVLHICVRPHLCKCVGPEARQKARSYDRAFALSRVNGFRLDGAAIIDGIEIAMTGGAFTGLSLRHLALDEFLEVGKPHLALALPGHVDMGPEVAVIGHLLDVV